MSPDSEWVDGEDDNPRWFAVALWAAGIACLVCGLGWGLMEWLR